MALLTRYVDHSLSTGNNDGTTTANAWWFLYKATAAMLADSGGAGTATTNQYKIYVKASETYGTDGTSPNPAESDDAGHDGAGGDAGAVIYLDTLGGVFTPNIFEGYHTTPGDGGIVTIDCAYDGANKLANGIWFNTSAQHHTAFKNFDVKNASADGGYGGTDADNLTFKNCRFKDNGGSGLTADDTIAAENCVFDNNGAAGANVDNTATFVSCIARNNTVIGIEVLSGVKYNCLAYDNGNNEQLKATGHYWVFGCTIDANNGNSSECIRQAGSGGYLHVANNIVYDAATGILAAGVLGDIQISRNCLFNSNTDDASNYPVEYDGGDGAPSTGDGVGNLGHVTGVPGFTGVYVPGANAQSAGLDAHFTNAFWVSFDAATNPPL